MRLLFLGDDLSIFCRFSVVLSIQFQSGIVMNRITFLLGLILISVSLEGFGQGQAPSVQIMAKKKSGIFGMGSSKFMDILLSNQKKVTPLTCDNVNEGLYYYFLCKTVGDWKFDQDFMKDELPKLSFEQGEQKLHTMWKEDIPQDGSTVFLIASYRKFGE